MIKTYGRIAAYIEQRLIKVHGFSRPLDDINEGACRKWHERPTDPLPVVNFNGGNYAHEGALDEWIDRNLGRKQVRKQTADTAEGADSRQLALLKE